MQHRPGLMIAIMPHGGDDRDEDDLDREGRDDGGDERGNSVAHKIIRSLVATLNHDGPAGARLIKLLGTAYCNMADSHVHGDTHGFDEACDEALNHLHEIVQRQRMTRGR